ncbi:DNA replication initiation factor cdc45 [Elasticomyces elasticus]|nr:DNA replication initiation factor cdc45 [Elasticomyces elasticus]KAK4965738.1 DNA replication initiation factor cdc45 [Elasticomyces elasticus]
MYLPRPLLPSLYTTLLQTTHPSAAPLLLLVAPTVDALCAARILTAQLRRDFVPHKLRCVTGYSDLQKAGEEEVKSLRRDGENGGQGGVVVCLGCGGGVDLGELLGLSAEDEEVGEGEGGKGHGVEVWVVDSRRSWNLENVFGGSGRGVVEGKLNAGYRTGSGVIVWDEGDIESELGAEREAWFALRDMPEISEEDMALAAGEDSEEEEEDAEAGAEEDDEVPGSSQPRKRKASSQDDEDDDMDFSSSRPAARRRRSNSSSSIPLDQPPPSSQPTGSPTHNSILPSSPPRQKRLSQKQLRKQLLTLRRKHEKTLEAYYDKGSWTGEPCSSILYSLVSELGREDNELLWLAVVGVESVVLSPFTTSTSLANSESRSSGGRRGQPSKLELVKAVLRDEVRRLNPPDLNHRRGASGSVVGGNAAGYDDVPTTARSATDTSIRLSPEPRFLLIRHWSLLDSMLHTTYLATRLHLWNEQGRKRLNKLLAKMGISLQEAGKGYLHLDLEVKRTLRSRVGKFAEQYGLEGLVPEGDQSAGGLGKGEGWGFVRSWGWRGTLSAGDVVSVVSAILEVGGVGQQQQGDGEGMMLGSRDAGGGRGYGQRVQGLPSPPHSSDDGEGGGSGGEGGGDWATERFFAAYDALSPTSSSPSAFTYTSLATSGAGPRAPNQQGLPALLAGIPVAQNLARAILRTGSALISKNQIRHLRSFRLGVVKEGPDVVTFRHPGALVKLAGWVGKAVGVLEGEKTGRARGAAVGKAGGDDGEALVLGCLDEGRGVYVVVGLSSGSGMSTRNVGKTRKEKEEAAASKKRKVAERAAKKAERRREKAEEKKRKRERDEANGLLDSDDEGEDSDATEDSESSESSGSDSEDDEGGGVRGNGSKRGTRNRFGQAFQEVVVETGARVRIDSFEHSVVEVRKEDLAGFLEGLSGRGVVG